MSPARTWRICSCCLVRLAVVGEALLLEADRLGERVAAVEPGRLVGVGLVADLADELDVGGVAGTGGSRRRRRRRWTPRCSP